MAEVLVAFPQWWCQIGSGRRARLDSEKNHPKNNSVFSQKKQKECRLNRTSPRVAGHKWAGLEPCCCFRRIL